MGDTPILEISRLEEIFEDDTAGIADLLEAAMGTGATNQATLRDALGRHALDDVMRAAHAIKGSTANIGGNEVAAAAAIVPSAAVTARIAAARPGIAARIATVVDAHGIHRLAHHNAIRGHRSRRLRKLNIDKLHVARQPARKLRPCRPAIQ